MTSRNPSSMRGLPLSSCPPPPRLFSRWRGTRARGWHSSEPSALLFQPTSEHDRGCAQPGHPQCLVVATGSTSVSGWFGASPSSCALIVALTQARRYTLALQAALCLPVRAESSTGASSGVPEKGLRQDRCDRLQTGSAQVATGVVDRCFGWEPSSVQECGCYVGWLAAGLAHVSREIHKLADVCVCVPQPGSSLASSMPAPPLLSSNCCAARLAGDRQH